MQTKWSQTVKWLVIYTNIYCFLMESHTIRALVVRMSLNTCQIAHCDLHGCKHIIVQLIMQAFIQSKNSSNRMKGLWMAGFWVQKRHIFGHFPSWPPLPNWSSITVPFFSCTVTAHSLARQSHLPCTSLNASFPGNFPWHVSNGTIQHAPAPQKWNCRKTEWQANSWPPKPQASHCYTTAALCGTPPNAQAARSSWPVHVSSELHAWMFSHTSFSLYLQIL